MTEPPRYTGNKKELFITGYILPMIDGHPVFIEIPGMNADVVAIFSTREALERAKAQVAGFEYDALKVIENGQAFIESLPKDGSLEVVLDPVIEGDRTRFGRLLSLMPS